MTTLRQISANRLNAQKSTGPRTQDGKERSRANRYTHGLAGDGIVLADDEAEIVAVRLVSWGAEYDPRNQDEKFLFEQMVLESVRIERCQHHEQGLLYRQVVDAEQSWDDLRTLEATQLGNRLAKKPKLVSVELQTTAQGCALLIDRWTGLLEALKPDQPWDDPLRSLAMDLLGIIPALRDAFSGLDPKANNPDVVEHQSALARREIERLTRRKLDRLDPRDAVERELSASGYALPTREMHLLRRYEAACHRRLDRAMQKLASVRRPPAPAPVARPKSIREILGDPDPEPIDIEEDEDIEEMENSGPSSEEPPDVLAPEFLPGADAPALPSWKREESAFDATAGAGRASSFVSVSAIPSSTRNSSTPRQPVNYKQLRAQPMTAQDRPTAEQIAGIGNGFPGTSAFAPRAWPALTRFSTGTVPSETDGNR